MTVFIDPCYTEWLNWLLGLTLCPCRPIYCRRIAITLTTDGLPSSLVSVPAHASTVFVGSQTEQND